jgi:hypothetical protein
MRRLIVALGTTLLVSGGLGWACVGLAPGTAQAGSFHWCPGDPPPQAVVPKPNGGMGSGPVNPDWDTTVCHDYVINGGNVEEGTPCILPTFQQAMCPPGTTPQQQMVPVPNKP